MGEILKAVNLGKSYIKGRNETEMLKNINFSVEEGDFVRFDGDSKSGKNILVNIIGGMGRASYGKLFVYNDDITKFDDKQLNDYRRRYIGYVSKNSELINNLSLKDNVMLVSGNARETDRILDEMGLYDKANVFPSALKRVEQISVLLARAMAKSPALLLCDDPAFGLDERDSSFILTTIFRINRENGITIIGTQNETSADKIIKFKDGCIESIEQKR